MQTDDRIKSQARLAKEERVGKLSKNFADAKSLIFWDYSNLNVPQIQNLRSQLDQPNAKITVAKNTLIALALKNSHLNLANTKLLEGQTAALVALDEIDSLKILFNFMKNTGKGTIKFGFLDGKFTDSEQLNYLATLPSKEGVFASIINTLNSPIYSLVDILETNLRNLVSILNIRGGEIKW